MMRLDDDAMKLARLAGLVEDQDERFEREQVTAFAVLAILLIVCALAVVASQLFFIFT